MVDSDNLQKVSGKPVFVIVILVDKSFKMISLFLIKHYCSSVMNK